MNKTPGFEDRVKGALYGLFIGDALAMPVHWYYDTRKLARDYGQVKNYMAPRNPHPDSILWRSSYSPQNKSADILHDQSQYWGQRGIHYHQFLKAGENTLNLKLAGELLKLLQFQGAYDPEEWLTRLAAYMTTPGNHNDTYVEEYLRYFFTQYGQGCDPMACGRKDENHIGGLSLMLPIAIVFARDMAYAEQIALGHLGLTHGGPAMENGGKMMAHIILDLLQGRELGRAVFDHYQNETGREIKPALQSLFDFPDQIVVGRHFSSACYMDQSIPATLYLALKYCQDPEQALIANTMCGGDNAGRGSVLGAILGAANGFTCWPNRWITGLRHPPAIVSLNPPG
ncbi:putative ADP-ribosylglycohydrolase [Desulforapulum autotrophicum HRM2]|uniref:ADP-ribosylglycohydrolase n=1 Tax=Desulforapulum autotrophicum (strain ATCC 43914 / DSM 3382 / VKM B-1955 / HRM2) TaxID=177437 RepID=C0QIG1_DESAH|nr:ADP-ribosylglycohydrolase family protein [Desulforapulum autotrophicum]ACN17905.1 putative ADP-ribosylglycohydrolase [Desulforapulum autotrophicum HRM2]